LKLNELRNDECIETESRDLVSIFGVKKTNDSHLTVPTLVKLCTAVTSELLIPFKPPIHRPVTPNAIVPSTVNVTEITGPSASSSTSYVSPRQLFPLPNLTRKSSNRGRKATKSIFFDFVAL